MGDLTYEDLRLLCDAISNDIEEWQGIPVPLGEDTPLVLNDRHPLRSLYKSMNQSGGVEIEFVSDPRIDGSHEICDDETIVNAWFCRQRNVRVFVFHGGGKAFSLTIPVSPDRSMDRLTLWLQTLGASDAWDIDAEHKAREHLRAMVSERQWRHYDLTGSFFETSPRSQLTYVFRRLRPTIALSPRNRPGRGDNMRCLAVLCMHPIGYYAKSWAGCMVPTDDVIAHLTFMRGDEAWFWKQANQHALSSPEAGL